MSPKGLWTLQEQPNSCCLTWEHFGSEQLLQQAVSRQARLSLQFRSKRRMGLLARPPPLDATGSALPLEGRCFPSLECQTCQTGSDASSAGSSDANLSRRGTPVNS